MAKTVTRGDILSADGKVLATSKIDKSGNEVRSYPYNNLFCHVIGRNSNGKTGVEASQNVMLLTSDINPFVSITNQLRGIKNPGNNVITTLNVKIQQVANKALEGRKGAIVVLEPDTGKCIGMVSKPDYNPNEIAKLWDTLVKEENEDSSLLNRVTQGLYPPGSTFKTITALAFMRQNPEYHSFTYECTGQAKIGTETINCYNKKKHGKVDLETAFAKSCNCAFAEMGYSLNQEKLTQLCETLYFNNALFSEFEYNKSSYIAVNKEDIGMIMQTSIGQGKTTITPMHNAMLVSAIVNDGVLMSPYIVEGIEDANGNTVSTQKANDVKRLMSNEEAKILMKMMDKTVSSGTASALSHHSYRAGGKTGSAEFGTEKKSHAWFVGYGIKNNKKLVVSIIVEGAGTGSDYAVPIAEKIFNTYWD